MNHNKGVAAQGPPEASATARRIVRSLESAGQGRSIGDRQLLDCARHLMKTRAEVAKVVPSGLFRDSAWDVMLELFVNGEEGGIVYVKQLIIATGQAGASAVRLIDRLECAGLLQRRSDPLDQRRIIVGLTEYGRQTMFVLLIKISELKNGAEQSSVANGFSPRR